MLYLNQQHLVIWHYDRNVWCEFYFRYNYYYAVSQNYRRQYKGKPTYFYKIFNQDGNYVGKGEYRTFSARLHGFIDGQQIEILLRSSKPKSSLL